MAQRYLCAVEGELRGLGERTDGRQVGCVALEGLGALGAHGVGRVLQALRSSLGLAPEAEVLLRCLPNQLGPKNLEECLEAGVNRVSVAFGGASQRECGPLGLPYDVADFKRAADLLRSRGFRDFEVQLLLGLPHQDVESFEKSLVEAVCTGPIGIELRPLSLRAGSPLGATVLEKGALGLRLPGTAERAAMFERASLLLGRYGYRGDGAARFAFAGRGSRYIRTAASQAEVIGVGAGAITVLDGAVRRNAPSAEEYLRLSDAGEAWFSGGVTPELGVRMLAMRTLGAGEGLPLTEGGELSDGSPLRAIREILMDLESRGLLERAAGLLRKSPLGLADPCAFEDAFGLEEDW